MTPNFLFSPHRYVFFLCTLKHTNPIIPSTGLLLSAVALSPLSLALGCVVRNADALVVAVPTAVFVLSLPGLLYFDLAFDVQRNTFVEVCISLLPPSGAALLLRHVCGTEALNAAATWGTLAHVSKTRLSTYVLVLLLDCVGYAKL